MPTRECPSCASEVPSGEDICPICNYEFAGSATRRNWRAWVAVVLLIIFLYPLVRLIMRLW